LDENSGVRLASDVNSPSFGELLFSRELYKSSAFRLGLAISAIYLLCFSFAWGLAYQLLQDGVRGRVDASITGHYDRMLAVHRELGPDAALQIAEANANGPMTDGVGFQLQDADGAVISGNIQTKAMEWGWWTEANKDMGVDGDGTVRVLVAPLGENTVTIAQSLSTAATISMSSPTG